MVGRKLTVGIFSRDGAENYKWLLKLLHTDMFQSVVEYVLNVYITNNFRTFADAMTQCQFAILYHTKNRGRLNIANVTDSLYDEELKNMKDLLGNNVIVLLDDLEDSSDNTKNRILHEQPLILTCAKELFLISESEKQAASLIGSNPSLSSASNSQGMWDADNSIQRKIQRMHNLMEEATGVKPRKQMSKTKKHDNNPPPGNKSSETTKSTNSKHQDLDKIRSSDAYSSGRSDHPLLNPQQKAQHDDNPATDEENHDKRQRTLSRRTVFVIFGGVAAVLVVILIIVLCFTLL